MHYARVLPAQAPQVNPNTQAVTRTVCALPSRPILGVFSRHPGLYVRSDGNPCTRALSWTSRRTGSFAAKCDGEFASGSNGGG
jgi:hypothetical protein